jgi:hypothetical protein
MCSHQRKFSHIADALFDRASDLGNGHPHLPHLGNSQIRERSVLTTSLTLEPLRLRLVSASWRVLHCRSPLGIKWVQPIMS